MTLCYNFQRKLGVAVFSRGYGNYTEWLNLATCSTLSTTPSSFISPPLQSLLSLSPTFLPPIFFYDVACSSPSSTSATLFLFPLHLQPPPPPHREKPLALYIFTESGRIFKNITHSISAGAITHNDTFTHASGQMV